MKSLFVFVFLFQGAAFAQGTSGGGGGNLITQWVDAQSVYQELPLARAKLYAYLARKTYEKNLSPIDEKVLRENKIFDVILNYGISDPSPKPCYDEAGRETDASIHSSFENTICVSSARIAARGLPRVLKAAYLTALLAHEYSHLIGFDETEAEMIQYSVTYGFEDAGLTNIRSDLAIRSITADLNRSLKELQSTGEFSAKVQKLLAIKNESPFAILPQSLKDKGEVISTLQRVSKLYQRESDLIFNEPRF